MTNVKAICALLPLCSLLLQVPFAIAAPTSNSIRHGHYNYGDIKLRVREKRQSDDTPYIVTGVQTNLPTNGSMPIRLEVRQLQQNTAQWNLFLLALDKLQYTDQSELLSWYEVAGK